MVMLSVLVLPPPIAPDWAAKPLGAALSGCTDQLAADGPVEDNCQGQVLKLPEVNCSENAPTAMSCENRLSPLTPGVGNVSDTGKPAASIVPPLSVKALTEE